MYTSVNARAASAYKRVGVETRVDVADPHQLIEMLFDGLQVALSEARGALARRDVAAKGQAIGRSVRLLEEGLKGGLDLERGGEMAANLHELYSYCSLRLTQANLHNDVARIEEVERLIEPVAAAWRNIRPANPSTATTPVKG